MVLIISSTIVFASTTLPNFRNINPSKITLDNYSTEYYGGRGYHFKLGDYNGRYYISQYIDILRNQYNFNLIEEDTDYGEWVLFCSNGPANYSLHVDIVLSEDKEFNISEVGIYMINDFVMAENASSASSTYRQSSSVDVPEFLSIGGNIVTLRNSQVNDDDSTTFFYECNLSEDLNYDFVGRYINLLNSQYPFRFGNYNKHNYIGKNVAADRDNETWNFIYTGGRQGIYILPSGYQLELRRIRIKSERVAHFELRIAHGLTFAGAMPQRSSRYSNGGDQECWECRGSGRCRVCGGSGYVSTWTGDGYHDKSCHDCYGLGTCRYCGGSRRV